jgi:hypothetical protein
VNAAEIWNGCANSFAIQRPCDSGGHEGVLRASVRRYGRLAHWTWFRPGLAPTKGCPTSHLNEHKQELVYCALSRLDQNGALIALWHNRKEIKKMHDLMQKVLAGEPGYAAHPWIKKKH